MMLLQVCSFSVCTCDTGQVGDSWAIVPIMNMSPYHCELLKEILGCPKHLQDNAPGLPSASSLLLLLLLLGFCFYLISFSQPHYKPLGRFHCNISIHVYVLLWLHLTLLCFMVIVGSVYWVHHCLSGPVLSVLETFSLWWEQCNEVAGYTFLHL